MQISVVLCTYNGARYLDQQLDSLLAQTRRPDEVVVQDDGSSDRTWEILEDYNARHPQLFRLYRNEGVHGVNGNFYSAMQKAQYDCIAICDQDDIWLPNKLQRLEEEMGDALLIGSMNEPFADDPGVQVDVDRRLPNTSLLRMMHTSMIAGHTMLMRRELLDGMMHLEEADRHYFMYDQLMQVVAAACGRCSFLPEVLVRQRRHAVAATYTAPTNRSKSLLNILRTIRQDIHYYIHTREARNERAAAWERVLRQIIQDLKPGVLSQTESGVAYLRLVQRRGPFSYLRLTGFCLRHHRELLHTNEGGVLYSLCRALFFPISSAAYVRRFEK